MINLKQLEIEWEQESIDATAYNNQHQLTKYINTLNNNITIDTSNRLSVLSLFSGCGGLDLGVKGGFNYLDNYYSENPFDIIYANEITPKAVETYRHNFGDHIACGDITEIPNEEFPKADLVIGGFPCQDFSLAGKRQGFNVERGRLYLQMKRVIDTVKPKFFLAENVKNIMLLEDGIILKTIIDDFKSSGYNVYFHLYHAANYGIPQNRERVIIYGVREDLEIEPSIPEETRTRDTWVTTKEAIDDLWGRESDPSINSHSKYSKAKFYEGRRMQGNIRIKADSIAPTIRAEHHGNIEGHYRVLGEDENDMSLWRRLTPRECARIQSFPDEFYFPVAASSAYKQIGNAVPPVLGWHIARALYLSYIRKG